MPCLKCGGKSDDDALLCEGCSESLLAEYKFFLNPVLVGPSLYSSLRSQGSCAYLLGPNAGSAISLIPSADLQRVVKDLNVQGIHHEDLKEFYARCDAMLAHMGVPLKADSPQILLTDDAADMITSIVQKVNATEKMYPLEGLSDLYIRLGVVYWAAAHSILMRTGSKKWTTTKKSYMIARSKEYLSKVNPADDLYSIATRNMGMVCIDAEEWTAAEENLATAQRHFPNDVMIGEGLARAHLMLGNQIEALAKVDDAINLEDRPDLWVLKGRILRDLKRLEEALECFNHTIELEPRNIQAHDNLIETLKDLGRMEEASIAENQRALAQRPDLEQKINEMVFEFEKASGEVGAPEPKTIELERRAGQKPSPKPAAPAPPPRNLMDLANEALRAKDYDTAIVQARHVLAASPDDGPATLVLIEALIGIGKLKDAAPKVHAYYEKNRGDPKAWYWRGQVARREGRWGAAVQYFSKAVALDHVYVGAWIAMGNTLLEHDKYSGADEAFSRALEINDKVAPAWLGKGKAMKALGRWGAAVQCLDSYTQFEFRDAEAWLLKADMLFDKEKYKRAIEAYDSYIEIAGDESYALGRKGMALNAMGRYEEARQYLEESVRLDPENKEAAKWLRTLKGGES